MFGVISQVILFVGKIAENILGNIITWKSTSKIASLQNMWWDV